MGLLNTVKARLYCVIASILASSNVINNRTNIKTLKNSSTNGTSTQSKVKTCAGNRPNQAMCGLVTISSHLYFAGSSYLLIDIRSWTTDSRDIEQRGVFSFGIRFLCTVRTIPAPRPTPPPLELLFY